MKIVVQHKRLCPGTRGVSTINSWFECIFVTKLGRDDVCFKCPQVAKVKFTQFIRCCGPLTKIRRSSQANGHARNTISAGISNCSRNFVLLLPSWYCDNTFTIDELYAVADQN